MQAVQKIVKKGMMAFAVIPFFVVPILAEASSDSRAAIIDQELNCIADHLNQGVGWDDVCYTSPGADRERLVAKSMDEMIDEQNSMAGQAAPESVDDISREHSGYADESKSVDDTIGEQGVMNSEESEVSSDDSMPADDQYASNDPSEDIEETDPVLPEPVDFIPPPSKNVSKAVPPDEQDWFLDLSDQRNKKFRSKAHVFDLNTGVLYYTYREPGVMRLRGVWQDVEGRYEYHARPEEILNLGVFNAYMIEGLYAWGTNSYSAMQEGDDGSGNPLLNVEDRDDRKGVFYEGRLLLGKDLFGQKRSRVTPYIGVGVRQLVDNSGETSKLVNNTLYLFYDRKQTYFYLPLGFTAELQSDQKSGLDMAFNLEYDHLVKGYMNTHLTDMDGLSGISNEDGTFAQQRGFGLRASLKLIKHYGFGDVYLEPFIRYWNIKQSKIMYLNVLGSNMAFVEPENNTLEAGSKFGLRF